MKLIDILMVIFVALAWAKPAYTQTKTPAQVQSDANRAACEELATRIDVSPATVKQEQAAFVDKCLQEKNLVFRRQIQDRCQRAAAGMKMDDPAPYKNCMASFGLE